MSPHCHLLSPQVRAQGPTAAAGAAGAPLPRPSTQGYSLTRRPRAQPGTAPALGPARAAAAPLPPAEEAAVTPVTGRAWGPAPSCLCPYRGSQLDSRRRVPSAVRAALPLARRLAGRCHLTAAASAARAQPPPQPRPPLRQGRPAPPSPQRPSPERARAGLPASAPACARADRSGPTTTALAKRPAATNFLEAVGGKG